MKKRSVMLVAVCFLMLSFCGVVLAKEYKLNVYMTPQKYLTWCGVSVVHAWVGYKKGVCFSQDYQEEIVNQVSYKIRLKAELGQGWTAGDLEKALEELIGSSFAYHNHDSISSAFKRIKEEVKEQEKPLAISANACNSSGVPKSPMGHWMLIEALKLKNDNKDFDGAYIKDPLYGSSFSSKYETLRPRTWVRDLFTKWWIPNKSISSEFRQSVED